MYSMLEKHHSTVAIILILGLCSKQKLTASLSRYIDFELNGTLSDDNVMCKKIEALAGENRSQLLHASFSGHVGRSAGPNKHLVGQLIMANALQNHEAVHKVCLSLFDFSSLGVADELHGGVWYALLSISHTNRSFWETARTLCWQPTIIFTFFAECFHGVGHGSVLVSLPSASMADLRSFHCHLLQFGSLLQIHTFDKAIRICLFAPRILMRLWCIDGVYHSQTLYLHRSLFSFLECEHALEPRLCLKNFQFPVSWCRRANSLTIISSMAGKAALAFIEFYSRMVITNVEDCIRVVVAGDPVATRYQRWLSCLRGVVATNSRASCDCVHTPPQWNHMEKEVLKECFYSLKEMNHSVFASTSAIDGIAIRLSPHYSSLFPFYGVSSGLE